MYGRKGSTMEKYKSKVRSVEDVLRVIKSGDRIVTSFGAAEPRSILSRLHEIKDRVENVTVFTSFSMLNYEFMMRPDMAGHFETSTWFHGPGSRAAMDAGGNVSAVPSHLHNGSRRTADVDKPNVFMGMCTPVDKHGYVKLSMSLIFERLMLEECDTIILEVNPNLPNVWGETEVHIDQVDHFVEVDRPVPTIPIAPLNEKDLAIGRYVASLVNDGDTVQFGIGSIPNAVAKSLMGKKDLGVHTEMISSAIVDLVEAGVVNGSKKTLHPRKIIGTFVLGDQRLYDFVDDNPAVWLLPGGYVNHPFVVAKNDNMVSINTSMQVDLTGQAFSESIGHKMYSGSGGQNDMSEGAIHAKNGRSIICLYATAKDDSISAIVPEGYPGGIVTLSRNNLDYVVTEYGIAPLKGLSIRQRTENLINIAHPKFRDELRQAVIDKKII